MALNFAGSATRSDIKDLLDHCGKVLNDHKVLDDHRSKRSLQSFVKTITEISQMAERYAEPFRLAVVGDFKVGKSALINALLGEEGLVCEGVTPTTGSVTELWYSDESSGESSTACNFRRQLQPKTGSYI